MAFLLLIGVLTNLPIIGARQVLSRFRSVDLSNGPMTFDPYRPLTFFSTKFPERNFRNGKLGRNKFYSNFVNGLTFGVKHAMIIMNASKP
jgi:hypothetical protein